MLPHSFTEAETQWAEMFWARLQALKSDQNLQTEFLDPGQLRLAEELLKKAARFGYTVYGGYGGARRVCLNIFSSSREGGLPPVTGVKVKSIGDGAVLAPDEVRGEIMRLGILWEEVGDLVGVSQDEVVVFTVSRAAPVICNRLTLVKDCPVECKEVEPKDLSLPARRSRQITGTVASLRLDAIISLGFGLSRSRAVLIIREGLAKINWRSVTSPAARLEEGDRVFLAGRGELLVMAVKGKTRKGRISLTLTKFS